MRCFNWKMIAALTAAALAVWLVAPGAAAAAVPLLVLLACPLGMLVMMGAMGSRRGPDDDRVDHPRRDGADLAEIRAELAALRAERAEAQERRT